MDKLMSCPFCGHDAEELSEQQVKCTYCDARVLGAEGAGTIARLNWNTRADLPNKDSDNG
jgi:sarcosine oxidase delta subunit